jgi:superfamily II DNA or RNA helicase
MQPRDYQLSCAAAVREKLAEFDSTLVEAATGLGKTVIISMLARDWPGRVVVVAHRDELIRQAVDKLTAITGEEPGVEMGEERIEQEGLLRPPRLVVTSVQTMSRPGRHARFDPAQFGLLVIDEAHHAVAGSYRAVIDWFRRNPACKLLGVTATPRRADEIALGQVFESVAFRYGIEEAVGDGWLVPVSQRAVKVEGLDFSKVRSLAGDFHEGELEEILIQEELLHKVAAPTAEIVGDRPALVFCCSVKHAELMAAVLERYRPGATAWLSGQSDRQTRRETVEAYREGRIQYLLNCGLFLEGFDAPITSAVVMARPTKSVVLYQQVLGRGTRPLPGVVDGLDTAAGRKAAIAGSAKPNMVALDFVGNSGRHHIVTAADVLGGRYGIPVREYARETVSEEEREVPVAESLDRAEAELDLLAEEKERRRRIVARPQYRTHEVSPFDGRQAAPSPGLAAGPREADPATDKQVWLLHKRFGVSLDTARGYTKRQAGAVIDKLMRERA